MKAAVSSVAAAYLAVWFFWIGTLLGGQANVWLHNLSGGAWGEAIRAPLMRAAMQLPVASLLFLPLLANLAVLYPWAADAAAVRWQGELSAPAFKNAWLSLSFFTVRSIAYLLFWNALVFLSLNPRLKRSKAFAAAALIAYGFSMGLAAVDWLMSLMPLWYSSVFGWLICVGQMLAGMALGIVCATRASAVPTPSSSVCRDLGNLLLMYVLIWAYLAFSEFLIIWAENLPHEIGWYLARSHGPWPIVAWVLAGFYFCAPLCILLSRHMKEAPRTLSGIAIALLAMQLLDTCWLVLPSVAVDAVNWVWSVPLAAAAFCAVALMSWRLGRRYAFASEGGSNV